MLTQTRTGTPLLPFLLFCAFPSTFPGTWTSRNKQSSVTAPLKTEGGKGVDALMAFSHASSVKGRPLVKRATGIKALDCQSGTP